MKLTTSYWIYIELLSSSGKVWKKESSGWRKRNSENMKSALMLKEDSWFKSHKSLLMHIFEVIRCLFICIYAMCCLHIKKVLLHFHRGIIYNMQLHRIASTNNLHIFNWLDHLSVLFVVEFGLQSHTYFCVYYSFFQRDVQCAQNCSVFCVFRSLCGLSSLGKTERENPQ